jgi:hypothetical protein
MMGAATRVKACATPMPLRRGAIDEHGSGVARRASVEALSTAVVFRNVLGASIVAAGLAVAVIGFIAQAHGPRANRTLEASQDCSARYAALLDLAELARRDGKSSEIVVRGLSGRGGALSGCLPTTRSGPAPQ